MSPPTPTRALRGGVGLHCAAGLSPPAVRTHRPQLPPTQEAAEELSALTSLWRPPACHAALPSLQRFDVMVQKDLSVTLLHRSPQRLANLSHGPQRHSGSGHIHSTNIRHRSSIFHPSNRHPSSIHPTSSTHPLIYLSIQPTSVIHPSIHPTDIHPSN